MSEDLRTDDDIARLFADANPIPQTIDRPTEAATVSSSMTTIIDLDIPSGPGEPTRAPHRWGVLAAAAAIVVLVSGLVFVVFDDDSTPTDERRTPTSITAPDTLAPLPAVLGSRAVFDLIESFNARDADGMRSSLGESTSRETMLEIEEIIEEFPWYDAVGWRWTDLTCEHPADERVLQCTAVVRNRLSDHTGSPFSVGLVASVDGDEIERIALWDEVHPEYLRTSLEPFQAYVAATDPDAFAAMWVDESTDIAERAALFDTHITRFVDPNAPAPPHRAFLEAHAAGAPERAGIGALFAPDGTIAGTWTDDPDAYADVIEVVAALGFDWGEPDDCRVQFPTDPIRITCRLGPTTKFDAIGIHLPGQSVSFAMSAEGIVQFAANDLDGAIDRALEGFYEWMAEEHPDDAVVLLTVDGAAVGDGADDGADDGGGARLAVDPTGAPRLAELVDEFLRRSPGATPDQPSE